MIKALFDWLDHRVGYRELLKEALYERIPGGARWRYVWGSTLVFVFVIQMITGICLWAAYSPGATTAWESVYYIQHQMTLGWVIRGMHHFAAQAMVILMLLHLMQVIIDGAYKAPREVNFWLGLVLAQIVLFLGLTGYLLPWDQKGYYATQVATEIMGSAPFVGPYIQKLMQGGSQYGHHTLTRFFALHAGLLPAALIAFLGLHIYVFRRHGIKAKEPVAPVEGMFWPEQVLKDAVACLAVLAAILTATWYWHGAELTAPANPSDAYAAARPEWYYLFLFKFLQYEWVSQVGEKLHVGEAFGAIFVPSAIGAVFVLMPFLGRSKFGHYFNVSFLWVVIGIAGTLTGIAYYDDWYSDTKKGNDFRVAVEEAHRDGERIVELAQSPTGIPPEGAAVLLRNDPLTQGPKLFAQYCIDCHQSADQTFAKTAEGPELASLADREQIRFASREWIRSVVTDFSRHFQSLKGVTGERQAKAEAILSGSMQDWSATNGPQLADAANAADLEALIEFIYAQSRRRDALLPNDPKVLRGADIFVNGMLTNGTIDACANCHTMQALTVASEGTATFQLAESLLAEGGLPNLTNYGGTDWLKAFIANPAAHYGDNNAMPPFAEQLTPQQLDLLARWLAEDYYQESH